MQDALVQFILRLAADSLHCRAQGSVSNRSPQAGWPEAQRGREKIHG